ncbi:MAG: c-type cytochrome domain-containing protein, partial [Planctomycetaceae bacterium]
MPQPCVLALRVLLLVLIALAANRPAEAAEPVDYLKQVKPVLLSRCAACHGALKQEAGLRIDTVAFMIRGGDSGPILQAGDIAASTMIARISASEESERMPPEGEPLTPEQIDAIKSWIAAGAAAPVDEQPERDPRDHWAFRRPMRPEVPQVAHAVWSANPIDAFISAKHQAQGLTPQPAADKRT